MRDGGRGVLQQVLYGMLALLALSALCFAERPALAAFGVPPNTGHVTDTAGKLTESQRLALDAKLDAYRRCSTNEVAVLVTGTLAGETVDDVAYATFKAWKLGVAGKDNGVLLVIAPSERKIRIETGKGVGGELTDVQTSRIINEHIKPHLKTDQTFAAIDDGTTHIASALGTCAMAPLDPSHSGGKARIRTFLLVYGFVLGSLSFVTLLVLGLFSDHRLMAPLVFSAILTPIITLVVTSLTPSWMPAFGAAHLSFLVVFLAMYLHERSRHRGPAEGFLRARWGSDGPRWVQGVGYTQADVAHVSSSSMITSSSSSSYGGDSGGSSGGSGYSGSDFSGGGGTSGGGGSSDSY